MTIKHCLIVASGNIKDYEYVRNQVGDVDYVVSADGGANHLKGLCIEASIFMGDFDSIDPVLLKQIEENNVELVKYPSRKDVTDSEIAVDYCIGLKPDKITIVGVTGQRLDHTFANMLLLKKLYESGIPSKIVDDNNEIYYFEECITLEKSKGETISILPLSERVTGVYTEGLEYPLVDETLYFGSTRSISNVFDKSRCTIRIESGCALVLVSKD